ncbi:hypothetical protein D3C80_1424960 [compost metagenome]
MKLQGGLECQHADEVHGPDTAGEAAGAEHAPLALRRGLFAMGLALGHVQGRKAPRAGHGIGEQYQEGFMATIDDDSSGCRKIGEQLQTQPFHCVPLGRVFTRLRYNPWQTVQRQYRKR